MSYYTPIRDHTNASFTTPTDDTFLQARRRIRFNQENQTPNGSTVHKDNIQDDKDHSFLSSRISQLSSNYTQRMKPLVSSPFKPSPRVNRTLNNSLISSTPLQPLNETHNDLGASSNLNNTHTNNNVDGPFLASSPNATSDHIYHSLTSTYNNNNDINGNLSMNGSYMRSGPTGSPFFRPSTNLSPLRNTRGNLGNSSFAYSKNTSPLRQVHNYDDPNRTLNINTSNQNLANDFDSTPLAQRNGNFDYNSNSLQRSIFNKSKRPTLSRHSRPELGNQQANTLLSPTKTNASSTGGLNNTNGTASKSNNDNTDLQSPYMEIAISRIVDKRDVLEKLLKNLLMLFFYRFMTAVILVIIIDIDLSNFLNISIDKYYDKFMEVSKYFNYSVYCIFIYNILSSLIKLIKPQDQCIDLPLTNKQRKFLGLSAINSKSKEENDDNIDIELDNIKNINKSFSNSQNNNRGNLFDSPGSRKPIPDISLLTSEINRSFASLNLKAPTNNVSQEYKSLLKPEEKQDANSSISSIKEKLLNSNKANANNSPSSNRFLNANSIPNQPFSPSNRFLYTAGTPSRGRFSGFEVNKPGNVGFY